MEAGHKFIYMVDGGTQGINADRPMHDVFIIDSGAAVHCTGDRSLFSDDYAEAIPKAYIRGASGKQMPVRGTGSICNDKFQLQDVLYVPDLNQPDIKKTIISVSMLTKLGYSVNFDGTSCSVINNRKRIWTWQHEVVGEAHMEHGHYMLDYLRIPIKRSPVPTSSKWPRLPKSLWDAALSGWNTIIEPLPQRASAQRPEV
jgi:hypothetical protein